MSTYLFWDRERVGVGKSRERERERERERISSKILAISAKPHVGLISQTMELKSRVTQLTGLPSQLLSNLLYSYLHQTFWKPASTHNLLLSPFIYFFPQYIHPCQLTENLLANVIDVFLKANPKSYFNSLSCGLLPTARVVHCSDNVWQLFGGLIFLYKSLF